MSPRTLVGRRVVTAWRRLLHEEEGIALVMALGIMLVLTIALGTTIFLAASAAAMHIAQTGGQKAYALGSRGINNAIAVLSTNYPGAKIYPGDANLLLSTTLTSPVTTLPGSTTINVASTAGYNSGSNTISVGASGRPVTPAAASRRRALPAARAAPPARIRQARRSPGRTVRSQLRDLVGNARQRADEPELEVAVEAHGIRSRQESDRAAAGDVVRKATAVVPVVIPDSTSRSRHHGNRLGLRAQRRHFRPVDERRVAGLHMAGDITLENTATISETIPASLTFRAPEQDRGRNTTLAHRPAEPGRPRQRFGRPGQRPGRDPRQEQVRVEERPDPSRLRLGATDKIWGVDRTTTSSSGFTKPTLTCCSPVSLGGAHGRHGAPGRRHRPELHGLLVPERRPRPEIAVRDVHRHAAEVRHRGTPTTRSTRAPTRGAARST